MHDQSLKEDLPRLILSPNDVFEIPKSALTTTEFANETYYQIAELLERLAILERGMMVKVRTWRHHPDEQSRIAQEIEEETRVVTTRLHDILLLEGSYAAGHRMKLTPAEVYPKNFGKDNFHGLPFRNPELREVARCIQMIACFEQELESYLTRRDGLEEGERQAMIKDTLVHLRSNKTHLTKILIGYHGK